MDSFIIPEWALPDLSAHQIVEFHPSFFEE